MTRIADLNNLDKNETIEIIIQNEKLEEFPMIILEFINLKRLVLKNTSLKSLPKDIRKLTNLEVLELSGNYFKSIPEDIGKLIKLKKLILEDIKLIHFPKTLEISQISKS